MHEIAHLLRELKLLFHWSEHSTFGLVLLSIKKTVEATLIAQQSDNHGKRATQRALAFDQNTAMPRKGTRSLSRPKKRKFQGNQPLAVVTNSGEEDAFRESAENQFLEVLVHLRRSCASCRRPLICPINHLIRLAPMTTHRVAILMLTSATTKASTICVRVSTIVLSYLVIA